MKIRVKKSYCIGLVLVVLWAASTILCTSASKKPAGECDTAKSKLQNTIQLNSYEQIVKNTALYGSNNSITVPPFTEIIIKVDTYCMNSGNAAPSSKEVFTVTRIEERNKVRKLLSGVWGKCRKKRMIQSIIWNITSKRHPRDLPRLQRVILYEAGLIDEEDVKLFEVEEMMFNFSSWIFGDIIMNTLDNYSITNSAILNRKSRFEIKQTKRYDCHYPFLFTVFTAHSYTNVSLGIYNSTGTPQTCRLTDYHLIPGRKDVQPLAVELSRKYSCVIAGKTRKSSYEK
ncbi:MAG: hypothetical protein GY754_40420 [bacterium]|nr:hypothetical protein [bacterium]